MTEVEQYVWRMIDRYDNGEIEDGAFVLEIIQTWMTNIERSD